MKKHLFLTSLVAIAATTSVASAASDVTFSGMSERIGDINALVPNDKGEVHVDPSSITTPYTYTVAKTEGGEIVIDDESGKIVYEDVKTTYDDDVVAGNFFYLNESGNTTALQNPNTDGKFDEASIEYVYEDAEGSLAWNTVLNKSDYAFSYDSDAGRVDTNLKDGAWKDRTKDYNLSAALKSFDEEQAAAAAEAGDEYNSILENITVSNSIVKFTNGTAGENKTVYEYTASNGKKYHLNQAGNGLVDADGEIADLDDAAETTKIMTALGNVASVAGNLLAEEANVLTTAGGTKLTTDEESWLAAYNATLGEYNEDQEIIDGLKLGKESRDAAIASYNAALSAQKTAVANQKVAVANADALAQEAYDLYNAPIAETIDSRADERIELSLNEGGAIRSAINEGVSEAKAYADAGDALTLSKANAYTDKKFDSLEKDMSGGVAAATALSAVSVSGVNKGEVSVGGGYGYFNGQSAMAFGAAMGLSDSWSINAGAGIASGDSTQFSIRAGTNYKFKLF